MELVLRYSDGSSWSSSSGGTAMATIGEPLKWESYDADKIYLQNLWEIGGGGHGKGQLGSSGGGAWYYAPHEYIDLQRIPQGTPLSPPGAATATWQPAVQKPAFENLVVRSVPPIQVLPDVAAKTVRQLGPGHFFFDLGREIQGGLKLQVSAAKPLRVTVRFAEELLKAPPPPPPPPPPAQCVERVQESLGKPTLAQLSCAGTGAGSVITGVSFASFGTASGSCSDPESSGANTFKIGRCNAKNTTELVKALCVGEKECAVESSTRFFGEPCHHTHKWLDIAVHCSGAEGREAAARSGESTFGLEAGPGEDKTCITDNTSLVGRPCFDMRTGSRYEDVWTIPKSETPRAVQNHEYLEGRFGELIFNDSSVTAADVKIGAWVARQRYAYPAQMTSSSDDLDRVFELCRYTSEATSLDLYADSNARQRSADCMADDNVAMRLAYGTSGSLALQRFMMRQALTLCGAGKLGGGHCRAEWT